MGAVCAFGFRVGCLTNIRGGGRCESAEDACVRHGDGTVRGQTVTRDWTWHEIEMPVPAEARNINFGFLLDGSGSAWFDAARIEINGAPYFSPEFDFDFESATLKGLPHAGDTSEYQVGIDRTTSFTGRQSLKIQSVEPDGAARSVEAGVKALDPATADDFSRSTDHSTPAGTGGSKDLDTGLRLAAFEVSSANGGDAIITDLRRHEPLT